MRRVLGVAVVFFVWAGSAQAGTDLRRDGAPPLPESVTTAHFVVHYTSAAGSPDAVSAATAQTVAANAESALAVFQSWGYPAPLDDGDGHVDISVYQFTGALAEYAAGVAYAKRAVAAAPPQWAGEIALTARYATGKSLVAHELFHVVQYGLGAGVGPSWLLEAGSRWAEHSGPWRDGWASDPDAGYLAHPEMPFDCSSDSACAPAGFDGGYERWIFLSYLANRFGNGIVRDLYSQSLALRTPTTALDTVLAAHGSSLAQTWSDFAVANAAHSYPAATAAVPTLDTTAGTTVSTTVSHLAARYVRVQPVSSSCAAVTLHVRVAGPADARPAVVVGSTVVPATNGAADLTWSPCGANPVVVLPNASTTQDNQPFSVVTSTGTDTPATPTVPKTPSSVTPGDPAPTLTLLGLPPTVTVSSSRPALAISVAANAPGRVELALEGAAPLATRDVTLGTNTVRVPLPRGLRGRKTLLLTSISPGGTRGTTLRVALSFVR